MSFGELALRRHYNSDETDVLAEFYRPLLSRAVRYDRAVGYFSSSALKACAKELSHFVARHGQIRFVVGCLVSAEDVDALRNQSPDASEGARLAVRARLLDELRNLELVDLQSAVLLSRLILSGTLKMKIAVRSDGIYHEKFGVLEDELGNKVAFIGSANETDAAVASQRNHESFSVFRTQEPVIFEAYGLDLEKRFERLWSGQTVKTRILDLDETVIESLRELVQRQGSTDESGEAERSTRVVHARHLELRPYQTDALKAWAANRYRGILAMATGTGKTLTALEAVKRFRGAVPGGATVITVPYQNLATQWIDAIREQGVETIAVFAGYSEWYDQVKNLFLAASVSPEVGIPCLVCVNDTFKDGRFQELLDLLPNAHVKHHLIIVDECHHFNTPEHVRKLPECFDFRLGLSATPYDQYATHYLDAYFGSVVYEFALGRAIREGYLTPYRYHVIACRLDEDESLAYEELTRKIVQLVGTEDGFTPEALAKAQPLLIRRARIIGAAKEKLARLRHHLQKAGRTPCTLFYCGDGSVEDDDGRVRQIERVSQLLHELGWRTARITAAESLRDRELLLDGLRRQSIDAVVSIKVLDEGIDIPACRTAYLLASQASDRQGIQRRGRVLRKSEGKDSADLYDFLVLGGAAPSNAMRSLAKRELRRAQRFALDALNADQASCEIEEMARSTGIELEDKNVERPR